MDPWTDSGSVLIHAASQTRRLSCFASDKDRQLQNHSALEILDLKEAWKKKDDDGIEQRNILWQKSVA